MEVLAGHHELAMIVQAYDLGKHKQVGQAGGLPPSDLLSETCLLRKRIGYPSTVVVKPKDRSFVQPRKIMDNPHRTSTRHRRKAQAGHKLKESRCHAL